MVKSIKYGNWIPFRANVNDDSTTDFFEDDEPLGDGNAATHVFFTNVTNGYSLIVNTIHYYFDPTNAVTPTMYLLADNQEVAEDELPTLIFQSEPGLVDSQLYLDTGGGGVKLPTQTRLEAADAIWMKLDWTGAPGNTTAFITVEGMAYL